MTLRVATDIGGTFTDLVVVDAESGEVRIAKVSTTPGDLAQGVLDVIAAGDVDPAAIEELVHGTTRRHQRAHRAHGRAHRAGHHERLPRRARDRPRQPPRHVQPRLAQAAAVRRRGATASRCASASTGTAPSSSRSTWRRRGRSLPPASATGSRPSRSACCTPTPTPSTSRRSAQALRERLPGVAVTASSDVTREWREYERTSTAVLNAYVQPAVDRYLGELEARLAGAGLRGPLLVMQSSAGTGSAAAARARPIALVESGPAGGVAGAARDRRAHRRART